MSRGIIAFAMLILVVLAISCVAERHVWPAEPSLLVDAQAKGCSSKPERGSPPKSFQESNRPHPFQWEEKA